MSGSGRKQTRARSRAVLGDGEAGVASVCGKRGDGTIRLRTNLFRNIIVAIGIVSGDDVHIIIAVTWSDVAGGLLVSDFANISCRPRCGAGAGRQARLGERAWYVVRTKRAAERRAQLHLERRGVVTYLPMLGSSSCSASGDACAAVFPQHLHVHVVLTQDLHRVLWAPGVKSFVPNVGEARPYGTKGVDRKPSIRGATKLHARWQTRSSEHYALQFDNLLPIDLRLRTRSPP
jgi:hypothetical protein